MNWYVELTYSNGETENLYCTSRDEARERRRYYLKYGGGIDYPDTHYRVVKATVRRIP